MTTEHAAARRRAGPRRKPICSFRLLLCAGSTLALPALPWASAARGQTPAGCLVHSPAPSRTAAAYANGLGSLAYQQFPTAWSESPAPTLETAWLVAFDHAPGLGLFVTGAWFKHETDGSFSQVLDRTGLSELYTKYRDGTVVRELGSHDLIAANSRDAGRCGRMVGSGGKVVREVLDKGILWRNDLRAVRGQMMVLWGTIAASSYNYIIRYEFHDDGTFKARTAPTGELHATNRATAHTHSALWRIDASLGDGGDDSAYVRQHVENLVEFSWHDQELSFNDGAEGAIDFEPTRFTEIQIADDDVAYDLRPLWRGVVRQTESWLQNDFWVTVAKTAETDFTQLPTYASEETVSDADVVLWHTSSSLHLPRNEDGDDVNGVWTGAALATWSGFDLRPRDVFEDTPFHPIDEPSDPSVTVSFGAASYSAAEGEMVNVVVGLDQDPERSLELQVSWQFRDGATAADFSGLPRFVRFGPGVTRREVPITAEVDGESEGTETLLLSIPEAAWHVNVDTASTEIVLPNRPPESVATLTDLSLRVGEDSGMVDVADAFHDYEDPLTYTASSSQPEVAALEISGSRVTVTPLAQGVATLTVKATEVNSFTARTVFQNFDATVEPMRAVVVAPTAVTVNEGETTIYTVHLAARPSATVTVTPSVPEGTDISVEPPSLAFTQQDWSQAKTLTVTAATDGDAIADPAVTINHETTGGDYDPVVVPPVAVTIVETDTSTLSTQSAEAAEGTGAITFEVTLSAESASDVRVNYATRDGTGAAGAVSGSDYTAASGPLTFPAQTTAAQPITINLTDDDLDEEEAESFHVTLSNVQNAELAGGLSTLEITGTILDDDDPEITASFGAASYEVAEGSRVTVAVLLDHAPERELRVPLTRSHFGGTTPDDYDDPPDVLTFGPNATSREFQFIATDDADDDDDEAVVLGFGTLPALVHGVGQTIVTILDDDDPEVTASFGAESYEVEEGGSVTVAVLLDVAPERELHLPFTRSHFGGATPDDYDGPPDVLTFAPDATRREFQVAATDDTYDDDGETVVLGFGSLPRVHGEGKTTLAILDNDSGDPRPFDGEEDGQGERPGTGGGGGGQGEEEEEEEEEVDPPPSGGDRGPPRAAISVDATCDEEDLCRARTGVPVRFEDASSGSVGSRLWDFDDGQTSRSRTVEHAWRTPGFYDVTLAVSGAGAESTASIVFLVEASDPAGTCAAGSTTLCLRDSRYAVEVQWQTASGDAGAGRVARSGTNDSGMFWFFDADNWEVLIKVLDGCALNGNVWVFGASTTDLGYVLRVTDTVTRTVKEYRNEPGRPADAITDATAFPDGCTP